MTMFLLAAVSLLFAQTPPAGNPACSLLTTAQVTSLIGTAKTLPVTATPTGSTCILKAGDDKMLTVLIANTNSPDAATRVFASKKLMMKGQPMPGWTLPAYEATRPSVSAVGFLKGQTFTEVKLQDRTQDKEAAAVKLRAVMKDVAGR